MAQAAIKLCPGSGMPIRGDESCFECFANDIKGGWWQDGGRGYYLAIGHYPVRGNKPTPPANVIIREGDTRPKLRLVQGSE